MRGRREYQARPASPTVPGRLDLALVSVATAADLGEVVIDVAHKGAHGIVVLTGNDVRPGDNMTVINLARAYGIRALGPDALGLINTAVELNATPGPMPRKGGVGMFCQSAAVGVAVLNHAVRSDLGVSSFISTGDFADVTANDVMQYWEDDAATRVCLLSLDSIGNPRKFSRITRRLTRRKPVVVFAPGRTSRASHSGVRGGLGHAPEEAVDALFRQAGVMVVHRRSAMIDVAKIAARQPLPSGPRVRIVTNSVTLAAQMTHTVEAVGLLRDPTRCCSARWPIRQPSPRRPGPRWPTPRTTRWSAPRSTSSTRAPRTSSGRSTPWRSRRPSRWSGSSWTSTRR